MRRGLSVHVGLNAVDRRHYHGWSGALQHAEQDAVDLRTVADTLGYDSTLLLAAHASHDAVSRAIGAVAEALRPGDAFLLTYAGCGGRVAVRADGGQRTWALFDRQLLESELSALFARFDPATRIAVAADTCHSSRPLPQYRAIEAASASRSGQRFRFVPDEVARETYAAHRDVYAGAEERRLHAPAAGIVVLTACQENQLAAEGFRNGLFTAAFLAVWQDGRFRGGYREFHRAVQGAMPPWQSPAYVRGGGRASFPGTRPFEI